MMEIEKLSKEMIQNKLLALRGELQRARFSVAQRQLKNVRNIRELKKDIARLETALKKR